MIDFMPNPASFLRPKVVTVARFHSVRILFLCSVIYRSCWCIDRDLPGTSVHCAVPCIVPSRRRSGNFGPALLPKVGLSRGQSEKLCIYKWLDCEWLSLAVEPARGLRLSARVTDVPLQRPTLPLQPLESAIFWLFKVRLKICSIWPSVRP